MPILLEPERDITIAGIVTTRQDKIQQLQEAYNIKVQHYRSVYDLLNEPVDAILVAVSPWATAQVATICLRAGKHVYAEEPMAPDTITALRLQGEAQRSDRAVLAGENFQHQQRFAVTRDLLRQHGAYVDSLYVSDRLRRGLRTNPRTGRELLMEHIVHPLSAIRVCAGAEPAEVTTAHIGDQFGMTRLEASLKLHNGTAAHLDVAAWTPWSEDSYYIIAGGHEIRVKHSYNFTTRRYDDVIELWSGQELLVEVTRIDQAQCGMQTCWQIFTDAVTTGDLGPVREQTRRSVHDIACREAILTCAAAQRPVPLIAEDDRQCG